MGASTVCCSFVIVDLSRMHAVQALGHRKFVAEFSDNISDSEKKTCKAFLLIFIFVCRHFAWLVWLCITCVPSTGKRQKRTLNPLELLLQIIVHLHVGAGRALSQCSYLLSHGSSPEESLYHSQFREALHNPISMCLQV